MSGVVHPAARGPYAKTEARKAEIVEAALRVFAARGYYNGSLREVSRELGMSLTAVTHHFPNKSALLEAVLIKTHDYAYELDRSEGLVAWVLDIAARNQATPEIPRLLAIIAAEASSPEHHAHAWLVERYATMRGVLAEMITRDQAEGRIAQAHDPLSLAEYVIALWDGLQLQWLIDPRQDIIGNLRKGLARLLASPGQA